MGTERKIKPLPKGITLRKDGLYMGRFQYEGEVYTLYSHKLNELENKMNDLKYEIKHGIGGKKQNITLNAWFDTWMEEYKKSTVKISTYRNYKIHYDSYIRKSLGKKKLASVRADHIQKVYNDLMRKDFTTGTIKLVSAVLNGCFKQAEKNSMINKNPVPLATIPKGKERKERKVFTPEEQTVFLKYIKDSYLYNFFALALMTGMRNGELRGLKWSDIDFDNQKIFVNHTLIYIEGEGHILVSPKTKTSRREIPMIDSAKEILLEQRKLCEGCLGEEAENGYVYCLETGDPITRDRVTIELNKITKAIQVKDKQFKRITCHCLRHTFATRCIENGMQPQVLKTILGHSSLAMTMDLYSHVLPDK